MFQKKLYNSSHFPTTPPTLNHRGSGNHTNAPMLLTWQVKIGQSVPCNMTPVKPKYFTLAQLSIAAASALKLK